MKKILASLFLCCVITSTSYAQPYLSEWHIHGDSTCFVGFPTTPLINILRVLRPDIKFTNSCTLGRPAGIHVNINPPYNTWDSPNDLRTDLTNKPQANCIILTGANDWTYGDSPQEAAEEIIELANICAIEFGRDVIIVTPSPTTSSTAREEWMVDLNNFIAFEAALHQYMFIDTRAIEELNVWDNICGVVTCDAKGDGIHAYCEDCRRAKAQIIAEQLP